MKPEQVTLLERLVQVTAGFMFAIGVAAFDWRVGLSCAGLLLFASSVDLRRRP